MSNDHSEPSMLLRLAVSLFDEKIITLMRLDDDENLFCISMPFELNLVEEEDGFLLSTELFPADAKEYADKMMSFLKQRHGFIRWDVVELTDYTVMAFLRVSFDMELAKVEIDSGIEQLKEILASFFEQEIDIIDNSVSTLNFMWEYR